MAVDNPGKGAGESAHTASETRLKEWQRPVLHHLAAKEARGGGNPGNDGKGGGPGSPGQHS